MHHLRAGCSHTCACVTKQYNLELAEMQRCSVDSKVTTDLAESIIERERKERM